MAENDAARLRRNLVGADAIEEGIGVGPVTSNLAKVERSMSPTRSRTASASCLDGLPPVRAAEGEVLALAGFVVPARPLPAEDLLELRATRFQLLMQRRTAQLAADLVLLGRLVAVIHVVIVGDRHFGGVVLASPSCRSGADRIRAC